MTDLTDADRAFIRSLADKWHQDHMLDACREAMHYGLAAGRARAIDECAEVCEADIVNRPSDPPANYFDGGLRHCAAAIRALKEKSMPHRSVEGLNET